jgi:hypothetical protein
MAGLPAAPMLAHPRPETSMSLAPDPRAPAAEDAPPDHCVLLHDVFHRLPGIRFRRSPTDGSPVMTIPLGEREVSVPLRSLQREFAIEDDSPDGRMLGLLAESLDYVTCVAVGDRLPDEVVSGRASWEPAPRHLQRAATRLRLQMLAWLHPEAARDAGRTTGTELSLDSDPRLRGLVQSAFGEAAAALGLDTAEQAVALLETLAGEFAFVEALRERLLHRVRTLGERIDSLCRTAARGDLVRRETLTQVQRLHALAFEQFRSRFDDIDAQTGEIIATLRNAGSQTVYVRANRDWLYRCQRAWDPLLASWDKVWGASDEAIWHLVADTYQFLARRYLPANEWPSFNVLRQHGAPSRPNRIMAW